MNKLTEARDALSALESEIRMLSELDNITREQDDRLDAAIAELARAAEKVDHEEREDIKARAARQPDQDAHRAGWLGTGPNQNRSRNPWSDHSSSADTASEVRSRALTGIERWNASDELKESATATVARVGADMDAASSSRDVRAVAAHVLRYSDPLYVSAFRKYASDPETYIADLTPAEGHVWRAAREEQRAALGTSGAVLPSPLDPTIVLTNSGATDPMRDLARVDTTASKSKRYITSAGSTFSYDAELAEVSDDTFTETEVEIETHRGTGFIQASMEAWMDQPGFDTEVAKIIADGKQRLDASKFITGTGTNEPFGIETSLAGTASEIAPATAETLAADDVYALLEALPPRFRERATFQLELSTRNFIHRLHNPSGTEPALIEGTNLIGAPMRLNSSVDPYSDVDATATATNRVLFVGDWRQYVILDRIGTSVYFMQPGVLQNTANNLPDGRVGWFAVWRTGAKPLTTNAFRMLDVETTA